MARESSRQQQSNPTTQATVSEEANRVRGRGENREGQNGNTAESSQSASTGTSLQPATQRQRLTRCPFDTQLNNHVVFTNPNFKEISLATLKSDNAI